MKRPAWECPVTRQGQLQVFTCVTIHRPHPKDWRILERQHFLERLAFQLYHVVSCSYTVHRLEQKHAFLNWLWKVASTQNDRHLTNKNKYKRQLVHPRLTAIDISNFRVFQTSAIRLGIKSLARHPYEEARRLDFAIWLPLFIVYLSAQEKVMLSSLLLLLLLLLIPFRHPQASDRLCTRASGRDSFACWPTQSSYCGCFRKHESKDLLHVLQTWYGSICTHSRWSRFWRAFSVVAFYWITPQETREYWFSAKSVPARSKLHWFGN